MTPFQQKVYNAVHEIPRGKISTYRLVARSIGRQKATRAVGNALNKNYLKDIPCHRIICSDGRVGGYNKGMKNKIKILTSEGIKISRGIINLKHYQWKKFLK